jgi:ABC-type transport system involved in multi-copper enzyme maturation permease subunit
MILLCLIYVRRGAREGESTIFTRLADWLLPRRAGEHRHKPRRVWRNPIAWREATTRAAAGGRSPARLLFSLSGLAAGIALLIAHHTGAWGLGPATVGTTRLWLTGLVWIELAVVLLVVTNTAATTLTREKEALTMELLLATPLTSRYIVAGMLQGLVRLVVPLIGVPVVTVAAFVAVDLLRPGQTPVTTFEALLLTPLLITSFAALAAMIGLHFSLLSKKTVQAVMISTATVLGAAGLLWLCGMAVSNAERTVAAVVLPFTPFPALQALLDPWAIVENSSHGYGTTISAGDEMSFRITRVVFSLVAAAAYLGITLAIYNNMVRGFDMTVRKQSE